MGTKWTTQIKWETSVFDKFQAWGDPIPEAQKVNCICPECGYYTAWQRSPIFLVCGWCFSSVPQSKREALIKEITENLSRLDVADRVNKFVKAHSDRDKTTYPSWEHLPTAALQKLLESLKALLKTNIAA